MSDELRRGEQGLDEAIQRIAEGGSTQDALRALDDALDRMHSVEEFHKNRLGKQRYFAERDETQGGQVLAGLMYVRGLTHHQLATVSDLVDRYSDTYSDMYGTMAWRPFSQLPLPGVPEPYDRDVQYRAHVENQAVLDTLKVAQRFLQEIASI